MIQNPLFYTLFGHPVHHSLSPTIHSLFAKQFNLNLNYTTTDTQPDSVRLALESFKAQGGLGANITLPLKEMVYKLCHKTTIAASHAQAVNTIYWDENDNLCGDNTDGVGFLNDLKIKYPEGIKHRKILILGAGGAAAGIIPPLLDEEADEIYIVNRAKERALGLAKKLNNKKLKVLSVAQLNGSNPAIAFDIIINATSASLLNELFPVPESIIKDKFVYDLVYNLKSPTCFVRWATQKGAKQAHDGLGMLIEQAAAAFYIWHHKKPDTQPIYSFLRQ